MLSYCARTQAYLGALDCTNQLNAAPLAYENPTNALSGSAEKKRPLFLNRAPITQRVHIRQRAKNHPREENSTKKSKANNF
jgi:hypothetical protein